MDRSLNFLNFTALSVCNCQSYSLYACCGSDTHIFYRDFENEYKKLKLSMKIDSVLYKSSESNQQNSKIVVKKEVRLTKNKIHKGSNLFIGNRS